jgi:hypothetical protein
MSITWKITEEEWTKMEAALFEMGAALEESLKLQSHYALLLNEYDGGTRMIFKTPEAWLDRLRTLARRTNE